MLCQLHGLLQMFNDYVRSLESDYCTVTAFKQHCRMMRTVNVSLDRLVRKRTSSAVDYLVVSTCLLDMRACLTEKVLSFLQGHVASLAASVEACLNLSKSLHVNSGVSAPTPLENAAQPVRHLERFQGRGVAAQGPRAPGAIVGELTLMVGSAPKPEKR
jgi:hypothetical protein